MSLPELSHRDYSLNERKIANYLFEKNQNLAINFTKDGGSLNELNKIAKKVLNDPNISNDLKEMVCNNLKETSNVYWHNYFSSKSVKRKFMGTLITAPVIGKIFKNPVKASAKIVNAYKEDKERAYQINQRSLMNAHYKNYVQIYLERVDRVIPNFKGQPEKLIQKKENLEEILRQLEDHSPQTFNEDLNIFFQKAVENVFEGQKIRKYKPSETPP